ncbi:MAG: antibiotic biosynthesis monooxygenase [Bacteroidota bacterium]
MILEIAILQVKKGMTDSFEKDFRQAGQYISSIEGYISHSLQKCVEDDHRYLLQVQWRSLEAHTVRFRSSPQYQEWKKLLHHYYDPFPVVEHYVKV